MGMSTNAHRRRHRRRRRAKLQRLARNGVVNLRRGSECEWFKLVSGRLLAMKMEWMILVCTIYVLSAV